MWNVKALAEWNATKTMFGFGEHVEEVAVVQALRAEPPGMAADDPDRRRVFGAALQQFDELLTAAGTVGPASAPLPLFYALSQAGRAIAASHCSDSSRWDFKGHGLSIAEDREQIGRTLVRPNPGNDRRDAFSVVADSTGSEVLDGPVELRALWASIPHMHRVEGLGADSPDAIHLEPRARAFAPHIADDSIAMMRTEDVELPEGEREAALAERLANYPAADGHRVVGDMPTNQFFMVEFPAGLGDHTGRRLGEIGEPYLGELDLYLRPSLGPGRRVPSVLMTWWAVLLALSQLARYVPAAWTAALDRDSSVLAIPIESGLRRARRLMPRLVLHALTGRWS